MPNSNRQSGGVESLAGLAVGPVLLAVAAVMAFLPLGGAVPDAPTPAVDASAIRPVPMRTPLGDPPAVTIAGMRQTCNACHGLFETNSDPQNLRQHREIRLNHGINNECNNCHQHQDREKLVLQDGSGVTYGEVAVLCSQCHGPIYRDWQRGAHGKTLGYWNTGLGEAHKLTCTACHDPHSPAFAPLAPLPGPNTLRMGEPGHVDHGGHRRNPLTQWSTVSPGHGGEGHDAPSRDDAGHEGGGH